MPYNVCNFISNWTTEMNIKKGRNSKTKEGIYTANIKLDLYARAPLRHSGRENREDEKLRWVSAVLLCSCVVVSHVLITFCQSTSLSKQSRHDIN